MKKTEIAKKVFEVMDSMPLTPLQGGSSSTSLTDLVALSLVSWFCEASVQWAIRITDSSGKLSKKSFPKVAGTYITAEQGAILVGVPGDGILPSYSISPLAQEIEKVISPGTVLEFAAANLGVVKRDWEVKADSQTANGNQRYVGTVEAGGRWNIEKTAPALSRTQLELALDCARKFPNNGPWKVKDKAEAESILMLWLSSFQANISPRAVKLLVKLRDLEFAKAGTPEEERRMGGAFEKKFYGLALGFFRQRLAGSPFQWNERPNSMHSEAELQAVVREVVGA